MRNKYEKERKANEEIINRERRKKYLFIGNVHQGQKKWWINDRCFIFAVTILQIFGIMALE